MVSTDGPPGRRRPPTSSSRSLPPTVAPRSSSLTPSPARARWMAAASPPTPAPTTMASFTVRDNIGEVRAFVVGILLAGAGCGFSAVHDPDASVDAGADGDLAAVE